eukprot:2150608-Pyramimonas_sp.AAC.1
MASNTLTAVTFNVGSYTYRRNALLALLGEHLPHFLFLQECALPHGQVHTLRADLASLGYYVLVGKRGLCTVVRQGLNVAPIAATDADADFRVQRLAMQLGTHRVLIRHRHAHSGSVVERRRFDGSLALESQHTLTWVIGDFNERPYLEDGCDH